MKKLTSRSPSVQIYRQREACLEIEDAPRKNNSFMWFEVFRRSKVSGEARRLRKL